MPQSAVPFDEGCYDHLRVVVLVKSMLDYQRPAWRECIAEFASVTSLALVLTIGSICMI